MAKKTIHFSFFYSSTFWNLYFFTFTRVKVLKQYFYLHQGIFYTSVCTFTEYRMWYSCHLWLSCWNIQFGPGRFSADGGVNPNAPHHQCIKFPTAVQWGREASFDATRSRLLWTWRSGDKLDPSASRSVHTAMLHRRWSRAIFHFVCRLLISQHVLTLSGYVATSSSGVRSVSPASLHVQLHVREITREQSWV